MRRRDLLFSGAAPAILRAQSGRPSVLLIITDDQGYGDLGCHGNDKIRTPHIDRFASQSIELSQFHVSPVCAPTRSSLMTGRYNYRTGAIDTFLGRAMMYPDEVTIAEMFAAAGYRTGIFGKWHLGDNYPLRAIDQGFQEALVHNGGGIGQPSDPPGGTHYMDPLLNHNGKWERHKGYCTDVFAGAAIDFMDKGGPFFTYLATNAPHAPLEVDEARVKPYREMGLDETTARIYAMVSNVDENVGRVLDALKKSGQEENTIVIFMTDNGPQQPRYNAGMRGLKGTVYEGGIRVPFFIRCPAKWRGGVKVDRLAAHIDVLPTLLDACNVPNLGGQRIDGTSLAPLLGGAEGTWPDRTLYFQWHRGDIPEMYRACAARSQRWKLVNGKELYDLAEDAGEKADVAAKHAAVAARMRKGYEEWFRDVSSTRGYEPPRIHLGTPHENPVTLTRQDWRGPRAGWDAASLGYWEAEVMRAGNYDVTLRFTPVKEDTAAVLEMGGKSLKAQVRAGAGSVRFAKIPLTPGKTRVAPVLGTGQNTYGVNYVDIHINT